MSGWHWADGISSADKAAYYSGDESDQHDKAYENAQDEEDL